MGVRERYGIPGSTRRDCLTTGPHPGVFCPSCAHTQERREIEWESQAL
jgi:hypothetical protein